MLQDLNPSYRASYHRVTPYPPRGSYRGRRGRGALPTYRNKTLVLNGQYKPATDTGESTDETSNPTTPSWITKTDRHMQLINSSVYEKETQQRANAMEQTLRQKQAQKNTHEKAVFMNSMLQSGVIATPSNSNLPSSASQYEITVDGIRFHVVQHGSKLVKAPSMRSLV